MADEQDDRKRTDQEDSEQDGLLDHTTATGVKDGYNNSEHELEVSGMRHAPEDRERRRESYSKAEIDEDVVVSPVSNNALSLMEQRQQEEAGGGYVVRTPESKSLHDEMDRTREDERKEGD